MRITTKLEHNEKNECDFDGEFAEAEALLHSARMLNKLAGKIVLDKITERMKRFEAAKDLESLNELASEMPDCTERFYVFQVIAKIEEEQKKEAK